MYLGQKVAEKDPNNPHTFKMLMTINQKKRKKKLIFLNKMNSKKKKIHSLVRNCLFGEGN